MFWQKKDLKMIEKFLLMFYSDLGGSALASPHLHLFLPQTSVLLFSLSTLSRLSSGVGGSPWLAAMLLGSYREEVGEFCMTTRRMGDWLGCGGTLSGAYSLVGSLPRQSYRMQEMRKTRRRMT